MKKELLLATTIAGVTLAATAASAVTASYSGNHRVGVIDKDLDSDTAGTGDTNTDIESSFTVSLEETLDSGTTIAGAFSIMSESAAFNYTGATGLTLTFTDGSSLELLSAGNASLDNDVAIPGGSGEMAIAVNSSNTANIGIDGVGASNGVGLAWHSADDVGGIEGLSVDVSYSNGDETTISGQTVNTDSSMSAGLTYVTTSGDTTVTVGFGVLEASDDNDTSNTDTSTYHIGAVAVNGDLTVGVGVGAGDYSDDMADDHQEVNDWESMEVGVSYVSGDLTFTASHATAEAVDTGTGITPTGTADDAERTKISIDYAVASGVTTTIGYMSQEAGDEGTKNDTSSGSSWYIGTNLSF
jgi:hypothetical protein